MKRTFTFASIALLMLVVSLMRYGSSQVSTGTRLEILEAQREVDALQSEFNQNKAQIDNWKSDWDKRMKVAQDKLNAAGDKAFKEAHKDKDKENLDIKTWNFTKKPAEPPKKEEKK